ncbi:MAG: asparagine synthase (glutamine-hydrolyzing) [Candidatus Rokuibacteriota bacterium]|nr:MAG: asparagine synthase (glutamine-hydrolyzing) [Candidatus Rokubacteria bacterium]
MCGIAGFIGEAPPDLLPAMLDLLRHRGPDDMGIHAEPGVALGMTRLAIIDLVTGRQPMSDADERFWLVFNGEIYNFRELRAELEARGRRFRTQSDTEVILQAYATFGEACVERLRGMFAFALWDHARRALFLARDRLGKKPLYYWQHGGLLAFASEPKALLRHPAVSRDVDWAAFHHYLAFGYTPGRSSVYAGMLKLPPAHTATLVDGRLTLSRYWQLPTGPAAVLPASIEDTAATLREQLRDAVRLRLESDVPLGVFLSGGIDSSAVVASMREVTSGRITTVSIGFARAFASYDELPYARLVAERFGTDHHEEVLEPNVAELLPTIVRHFDEPFADSSAVPTFAVAQATARLVKVALSGIGGDETFGGYPRYLGVRVSELYARLPRAARRAAGALAQALVRESRTSRNLGGWVRRFAAGAEAPLPERYLRWTRFFGDEELARLATPALGALLTSSVDAAQRSAFETHGHGDPLDGAFRIDLATYLPDDLLVMADRMSMANSLELRAPFCDHRLVEASLAIPPSVKIPGRRLKGLLKTAFADVLPRPVLEHRKQGFMIPLGAWLTSDLRATLEDLLAPSLVAARGLFEPAEVERLRREHAGGARDHADRLFTLMMTELWIREYLDRGGQWSLGGAHARGTRAGRPVVARPRTLRILMVSDVSPARPEGGAERMLREQASRLAALGHRVRVVSRAHADGGQAPLDLAGVHVRHFPMDHRSVAGFVRTSILAARRATSADLAESPADVLHLYQPLAGYGALLSPAARRLPMLYTFHSPAPLEYRARHGMTRRHRGGLAGGFGAAALWLVERACLRRARLIHVLSDFSAGQLETLYRIPPERIVKIPGAVELERFRPAADRAAVRRALGLPEGRPLLLTVRNLERRMGLDLLLRAMARVKARVPEALLLLGGAGSLRGELEALGASLGLDGHVRFLGFIPDRTLPAFYQAADVFVLPTRELEGFGLVTVEALACGTPVLGTRVGATPEILAPLSPSLIFRGLAPETLADDLTGLLERLTDPADAARLRAECRRHAEAHYGWDRAIAALAEALERVAGMR